MTGIGVVIRNHRGGLLRIYSGSLGIEERRTNELYAMLQGLIRAYRDEYDIIELETDNVGAFWEWSDSMTNGVPPEHEFVTRQLNTRKEDDNQMLCRGLLMKVLMHFPGTLRFMGLQTMTEW